MAECTQGKTPTQKEWGFVDSLFLRQPYFTLCESARKTALPFLRWRDKPYYNPLTLWTRFFEKGKTHWEKALTSFLKRVRES